MITSSLITEACENILPAGSMEAMGAIGQQLKEKAKTENLSDPYASTDPGMLKNKMMAAHTGKVPSTIKMKCTVCGTVMGEGAVKCSVCNASNERLLPIAEKETSTNFEEEGGVSIVTSFDSKNFAWTHKALDRLDTLPPGHIRQKARARIEKNARSHNISTITLDFLNDVLDLDKLSSDG